MSRGQEVHRSRGPDLDRVQPVDAVRGVSAVHGERRVRRAADESHLRWVAEIGSRREEWKAEITHQEPDSHIAWKSIEGKENSGDVRFDSLGDDRTRIQVVMNWEPEGFIEATAEKVGRDESAVKADLERFKEMVENRGVESGEWRGKVAEGKKVD